MSLYRNKTESARLPSLEYKWIRIARAKCLMRMRVEVPESARMVLMQDEKFKLYYNHLAYTLKEYDRVTSRVNPVIRPLLERHLDDLDAKVEPGLQTITWTSMKTP